MDTKKSRTLKRLLSVTFFLLLPIQYSFSAPQGIVDYHIEWGSTTQAKYTYVFSGTVTCQNRPCPNAQVNLDLQTASRGVVSESTRAGSDGRYQIEMTLPGSPEQTSTWRLHALRSSPSNMEVGEAEGRVILIEGQTAVVIDRSLFLAQA